VREEVAFFIMRYNEELAGCGGVKIVPGEYGEVKRMYVRPQFRGRGFAKMM
jgi:GNAT superfamily N-acetyltransferase